MLVIPFYDLPWRIGAFLFVGRGGETKEDFVFRRANMGFRGNQHGRPTAEAGLAMHPEVLDTANDWDRTVIAIGDPIPSWSGFSGECKSAASK